MVLMLFSFSAKIENDHTLSGGIYVSGPVYSEKWTALKDPKASLPEMLQQFT
jgi:hypothetical protein